METFKELLNKWGELTEIFLNALSIVCILIGLAMGIAAAIENKRHFPGDHPLHTRFRMVFGGWLVVALEFQLASDIVGTIITPTTQHLVELGVIAVIRTFLNYFLNKELQDERNYLHSPERKKTMMVTK